MWEHFGPPLDDVAGSPSASFLVLDIVHLYSEDLHCNQDEILTEGGERWNCLGVNFSQLKCSKDTFPVIHTQAQLATQSGEDAVNDCVLT